MQASTEKPNSIVSNITDGQFTVTFLHSESKHPLIVRAGKSESGVVIGGLNPLASYITINDIHLEMETSENQEKFLHQCLELSRISESMTVFEIEESMLNGYTGSGYEKGFAAGSNTAWFIKGLSEVDSKKVGDFVTFKGKEYKIKSIIPGKGGMGPRFVLTELNTSSSTSSSKIVPKTVLKIDESMLNGYTGSGYEKGFAASSNTAWFKKGLSEVDSKEIGDLVTFKGKEYTIKSIIPGKGGMGPRFTLTPKK